MIGVVLGFGIAVTGFLTLLSVGCLVLVFDFAANIGPNFCSILSALSLKVKGF
ncbi:hypothetical protein OTSUT76_0680 [Orientia tsutsugamushi str. UT76]|nr:hypothetical protein OTSUT76_0680 [Orientia tsutsugamushi str. UT76]